VNRDLAHQVRDQSDRALVAFPVQLRGHPAAAEVCLELAGTIEKAQTTEIATMRELLGSAG
jgi:hypothetical protein